MASFEEMPEAEAEIDDLNDDERARLHAALVAADEERRAGLGIPAADILAELRRDRPSSSRADTR